jgi:hypothetical protein
VASGDFGFRLLYGFVIVRPERRDLVWINTTTNPTAEWVARQITEAFPWNEAPRYLIRDWDHISGAVVTRRLRAMGIRDRPTAAASPWQNGFAEGLIGSIRRASRICVEFCDLTHATITTSERIGRSTRMRQSHVLFSEPESSRHVLSSVDFTTTTSAFKLFGTHNQR